MRQLFVGYQKSAENLTGNCFMIYYVNMQFQNDKSVIQSYHVDQEIV